MGLSIRAYTHIEPFHPEGIVWTDEATPEENDAYYQYLDDHYDEGVRVLYVNPHFPGRADSLPDVPFFKVTESKLNIQFSYSGYSHWRDFLAQIMRGKTAHTLYEEYETAKELGWVLPEGPFEELICFSDCEGALDSKTCAKLAKDFEDGRDKVKALEPTILNQYFTEAYDLLDKGFHEAANSGAIMFT